MAKGECSYDGCPNPAQRGGWCWSHVKKKQRGHTQNESLKQRPKSPLERLTEAAIAYANAETDDDFDRAKDNLRKSAAAFAPHERSLAIKEALAEAKRQGMRLGPPRKLDPVVAVRVVRETASIRKAAVLLRVTRRTVQRALREADRAGASQT